MAYIEGEVPTVVQGNGYNNGGFFGSDGIWAILLFAMIFGNGWGGNFGGGYGNNFLYDVNANTNRGFDQLAVTTGIDSLQTTVSNGFANAQVQNCNSTANLLQAINGLSSNFAQCLTKHKKPIKCFATNKIAVGTCA
jgi:hypothetical protein